MIKNPLAGVGDVGSICDPGGAHMLQSDSVHAPQVLNLRSRAHTLQQEKPEHRSQRKSPHSSEDPAQPINK